MSNNNSIEIPFKHQVLTRQLDLIPLDVLDEQITVIGAGAIGSFTVLSLVKSGFENITVYDFDIIEPENMSSQFYRIKDIGKNKVDALQDLVKEFTGVEIQVKNELYKTGTFPGIVISAVDSMEVRKLIWDNHKVSFGTKLVIDPRMSAEFFLCYAMNPLDIQDVESYERTLYTDQDSVQERCTAKATSYTALNAAAHVVKIVKDYLTHPEKKYSRTCEWNIAANAQKCYPRKS